jgi:DNA-binding GntR family transcriptional regulator
VKGISKITWREGGPSRYHLIAEQLRTLIEQEVFAPGERLPSEKDMVQVYGWSRGTIRAACRVLVGQRLIRRRQGVGMFVSDDSRAPQIPANGD